MARPKKNTAQAQDTLLALDTVPEIPVEEQPYPLPEGWKWVRLGSLCSLRNGKAFKPTDWSESGLPIVRIQNLNSPNNKFNYYDGIIEDKFLINSGDLLFAWSGTPGTSFGAHIWKGGEALLNQHIFRVNFKKKIILKIFFKYAINYRLNEFIVKAHGGAGLQHITKKNFENTSLPLPPLEVQQRIVERIESLFAKLDEAREKAESALESFERRKAAILRKAFTGELTAHSHVSSKWKDKSAEELFTYVTSGSRGWAKYYAERGSIFIRMGNLSHKSIELDFSNIQYVLLPRKAEGQRTRLQKNDILISITADIGMVGLFRDDTAEAYINQHIALARPSTNENAEFIAWYLISDVGLSQLKKKQRGTTKVGLGLDDIRSIHLKMPSLPEQQEIVRILDRIFAREQQAREAAENVLQRIDQMKKAILARAFRGELG